MDHLYLQLFSRRFNELTENYMQQIGWVSPRTTNALRVLLQTIQVVCSKAQFHSPRSLIFGMVRYKADVLHFSKPITCCGKCMLCSDSLTLHLLFAGSGHADCALDADSKRSVILFNLYVQITNDILVGYNNNNASINQAVVENLHKAQGLVSSILQKPNRSDSAMDGLFIETRFSMWEVIFDYTCKVCETQGVVRCSFTDVIARYGLKSLVGAPIRHVESKVHAKTIQQLPSDQTIALRTPDQHSSASLYLLNLRQADLDKECSLREQVTTDTPFEKVKAYLIEQFSVSLGKIDVYFFGSRVTGVAQRESDLDVYIKSSLGFEKKLTFSRAVKCAEAKRSQMQIILQIPEDPLLLRVRISTLSLTLDLTFGSGYAVANSRLVSHYFNLQPLTRKMYACVTEWKSLSNISQQFRSYVLTMLIVFFMQQRNYLPAVEITVLGPMNQPNIFNVEFFPRKHFILSYPKDFLSLIKDFFAYWNQFDWTRNGICVLNGRVKSRESFQFETDCKPEPPMMASDYFNQSRNISRSIDVGDFKKFQMACQEADEILKQKNVI